MMRLGLKKQRQIPYFTWTFAIFVSTESHLRPRTGLPAEDRIRLLANILCIFESAESWCDHRFRCPRHEFGRYRIKFSSLELYREINVTLKKHISITGLITAIILLSSCNSQKNASETVFTASISPIKYLVEYITCGDFRVEVLVPDGASPESYSPSASQIVHVEDSRLIFTCLLYTSDAADEL